MPIYEFECPRGHIVDDLVHLGTYTLPCRVCHAEALAQPRALRRGVTFVPPETLAKRVLSPTPTTFRFADTRR